MPFFHFSVPYPNFFFIIQGMFDSPGMQSLMSQMTQNPQMMDNMLQAPYMQAMLQQMSSNPEMAQNVSSLHKTFAQIIFMHFNKFLFLGIVLHK